ncbi:MAG: glutamate-cysteine ligase family protein [Candidatus Binatia bacterium]
MTQSRYTSPYRLFAVTGLELEYPIVDHELRPQCLVEEAFRHIHGRPTSHIDYKNVGFSNELAAHVFEMKTNCPQKELTQAEAQLVNALRFFSRVLQEQFGVRLLPTGMHPLMQPHETVLWRRSGQEIYKTYARVFPLQGHGWLNVQSCQINLPFGTESETVALHNAIACLLPYLPALAANSPVYEGTLGPNVNNRLAFYRMNQVRIPCITGDVIPEFMTSYRQYQREILGGIYRALAQVPGAEWLKHEWVNSRGAILRFDRHAIEIRVLDTQECVKMDVAIAVFTRGVLKALVRRILDGNWTLPAHTMLVADLNAVIVDGGAAQVAAMHLWKPGQLPRKNNAQALLRQLLELAVQETPSKEQPYLTLIEQRLRTGNLSERIRRTLARYSRRGGARQEAVIQRLYGELIVCLEQNTPWEG